MPEEIKTYTQAEADAALASGEIQPDLAEPGYKRDEQLAERKDALEEAAETRADQMETHAINPKAFEKDREIQHGIENDGLEVEDAQSGYMYKWENYVNANGNAVRLAQREGWEVVQGDMPESPSLRAVDGSRRLGDVLLMRMRMDHHLVMELRRKQRRLTKLYGAEQALHKMQEQHPELFPDIDTSQRPSHNLRRSTVRRAAKRVAADALGRRLKEGTLPGVPIPGQR